MSTSEEDYDLILKHELKNQIFAHTNLKEEIEVYKKRVQFIKTIFSSFKNCRNLSENDEKLLETLKKNNEEFSAFNSSLKKSIQNLKKEQISLSEHADETSEILRKKKGLNFNLENALAERNTKIKLLQREIKGVTLDFFSPQEIRDIFVVDEEEMMEDFEKEYNISQEKLFGKLKQYNAVKNKILQLNKVKENLQNTRKSLKRNSNLKFHKNRNYSEIETNLGTPILSPFEDLFFDDFENNDYAIDYTHDYLCEYNEHEENEGSLEEKGNKYDTKNIKIPKLDLKQIEYNKSKVVGLQEFTDPRKKRKLSKDEKDLKVITLQLENDKLTQLNQRCQEVIQRFKKYHKRIQRLLNRKFSDNTGDRSDDLDMKIRQFKNEENGLVDIEKVERIVV